MIIFTDNINLATASAGTKLSDIKIYNLSSLISIYKGSYYDITSLITNMKNILNNNILNIINTPEFDILYMQYIFQNNDAFINFMKPLFDHYNGYHVAILVEFDQYRDNITESLIKIIQQRYSIISWIIRSYDDISCIKNYLPQPLGIQNLDIDISRFLSMVDTRIYESKE